MNLMNVNPDVVLTITAKDLQDTIIETVAMLMRQNQQQRWLTTAEATERYSVSWSTLKRLQQAGVLHPTRIGAQWRWSINELDNQF